MSRYIDADKLKEKKVYSAERHENVVPVAEIDWQPTADVVEVKHGEWKPYNEYYDDEYSECNVRRVWACSICGRLEEYKESYCNCGAKMDGERRRQNG